MTENSELPETLTEFCTGIGFVVLHWALLETTLDICVAIIYHKGGGNALVPELPRALKRKILFLKRSFKTLPGLEGYKDEGLDLLQKVSRLSRRRHDLVHSALETYQTTGTTFSMYNFDVTPQLHRTRHVKIELADLPPLSREVVGLASVLGLFCQKLKVHFLGP